MKVRSKLILNYSTLSLALLILFSFIILLSYTQYRQADFENRLRKRAETSVNMFLKETTIDSALLRLIDNNILTVMRDLRIVILDYSGTIVYSNKDLVSKDYQITINVSAAQRLKAFLTRQPIGIHFVKREGNREYTVIASARDEYGLNELKSLMRILLWVSFSSLLIIIGFGIYNAQWSLKPFRKIINEVESINPNDLKKRLSISGNDETSQLSASFNNLLERIEQAFDIEKSFISNASHELRTPITSIMGQIEVALNKQRGGDEYVKTLESVYEDTYQMADIINGFLNLAEANLSDEFTNRRPVRIDEILFAEVDNIKRRKPEYNISVEFITSPDQEIDMECLVNERLVRLLFNNLIDNACKYSNERKAVVKIDFSEAFVIVSIQDFGIGIPPEDMASIFKPLYRGRNASGIQGHGIGLAIVKRIADIHQARIEIKSEINIGTKVIVSFLQNHAFQGK